MISLSALNEINRIRHGFFTREGGMSQGIYASLNCGPGSADDPAAVAENRARAMAMLDLPAEALITVHQQHTAEAVVVDGELIAAVGTVAECEAAAGGDAEQVLGDGDGGDEQGVWHLLVEPTQDVGMRRGFQNF